MIAGSHVEGDDPAPATRVAVTASLGQLGRRVAGLAGEDPAVSEVVAVDPSGPDLERVLEGCDTLVHLDPGGPDGSSARLLDAAGHLGVRHLVLLSSATVYGAWADNPVPLTEDAPLRPNPGADHAHRRAELERLGADWLAGGPGRTVAVLRPTLSVGTDVDDGPGTSSRLLRGPRLVRGVRAGQDEPPVQLLDVDDLATAVDLARRDRLDGPFNVAPDGWLSGEQVAALAGEPPRVRLPGWLASWSRARPQPGQPRPSSHDPYSTQPWVIANDRLKAAGWAPSVPNDVAYVRSTPGTPWSQLSPKRRQELAIGAAGSLVAGALAGVVGLVVRARRRRA